MSNFDTFGRVTGGNSGTAPDIFIATTDDNLASISASGYVSALFSAGIIKAQDIIFINYDMDGTPGYGMFIVSATGGGTISAYSALDGTITNADIAANAAIAWSKMAAVGGNNIAAVCVQVGTATYGGGGTTSTFTVSSFLPGDQLMLTMTGAEVKAGYSVSVSGTTATITYQADPGPGTSFNWFNMRPIA